MKGIRQRHDPWAILQAMTITACLYGIGKLVPERHYIRFVSWALILPPEPPFIQPHAWLPLALATLGLIALGILFDFRAALWKRLTFTSVPKTQRHHDSCIIWLHGVGDGGTGFVWLKKQVGLANLKWVLPDAPKMGLTIGGRQIIVRAWLRMSSMPVTKDEPEDQEGLDASVARVLELIESQVADGIAPSRIVLGGFSQGAAVAAWAVAKCMHKLGGCVLWSGYPASAAGLTAVLREGANCSVTPFTYSHGDADNKVLPECGVKFVDVLRKSGVNLASNKVYPGVTHGCCPTQVDDLRSFLQQVLPKPKAEAAAKVQAMGASAAQGKCKSKNKSA